MDINLEEHRRLSQSPSPLTTQHPDQSNPFAPANVLWSIFQEKDVRECNLNDPTWADQDKKKKIFLNQSSKIKGLEELGVSSELNYFKRNFQVHEKTPKTRIYMTDFMNKEQKFKLLQLAGKCYLKGNKREHMEKEPSGQKIEFTNVFEKKEKPLGLFNTPPSRPKGIKNLNGDRKSLLKYCFSDRTFKIDQIIEECSKAIGAKPKIYKKITHTDRD